MIIDIIFNTLSKNLKNEEKEWTKKNSVRQRLKYSISRSIFISLGKHPVRNSLLIFSIFLILSISIFIIGLTDGLCIPPCLSRSESLSYFVGIWGIQSSLVSLVYPIVIGFVTLMLQKRNSSKQILQIYFIDSSAILTGSSALFLVLAMGIQYLFFSQVPVRIFTAWVILDTFWFLLNVGGIIYFIIRTFDFLKPDVRSKLIKEYCINVVWPINLKENLRKFIYYTAIKRGFIKANSYGEEKGPSVLIHSIGNDIGKPEVSISFDKAKTLNDVNFSFLKYVVKNWNERAKKNWESKHEKSVLVFPLVPGQEYDGTIVLCRVEGQIGLSYIEKFIIKISFYFKKKDSYRIFTINDLLVNFKSEIQGFIDTNDGTSFEEAIDEIVDFHTEIINSSVFVNDSGYSDNYTQLPDVSDFFENKIFEKWNRNYYELFEHSLYQIIDKKVFFNKIAIIPNSLFIRTLRNDNYFVSKGFIFLTYIFYIKLVKWWAKKIEELGITEHNANNFFLLKPPYFSIYESSLQVFVGNWESLKNYYFSSFDNKTDLTWDEIKLNSGYYEEHLEDTFYMLFYSVYNGDQQSSEWLLDILIKWLSQIDLNERYFSIYFKNTVAITIDLTNKSWDEVQNLVELEFDDTFNEIAPLAIYSKALKNYWSDCCLITLSILSCWGKKSSTPSVVILNLIRNLFFGISIKAGGESIISSKNFQDINHVFLSLIRQYCTIGSYRSGYRGRLDRLVEKVEDLNSPSMVSGRTYSGSGLDDLTSIHQGQLFILSLCVDLEWKPSSKFESLINQWLGVNDKALRDLEAKLNFWIECIEKGNLANFSSIFQAIKEADDTAFVLATYNLKNGLNSHLEMIKKVRFQKLGELSISDARLQEVAESASRLGFTMESAKFPINIFSEIKETDELLNDFTITIKKVNKGEYTEPVMAQRAINEGDLFARVVRDSVASHVMACVLHSLVLNELDASDPLKYWNCLKNMEGEMLQKGFKPLLLLENPTIPKWVWDWRFSDMSERRNQRPSDLDVYVNPSYKGIEGYQLNFNNTAVFNAPILTGASCVLPQEVFHSIKFTRFPNGHFVEVTHEPVPDSENLINLKLKWSFKLDILPILSARLKYGNRNDD